MDVRFLSMICPVAAYLRQTVKPLQDEHEVVRSGTNTGSCYGWVWPYSSCQFHHSYGGVLG
jgi:hypothetical protein